MEENRSEKMSKKRRFFLLGLTGVGAGLANGVFGGGGGMIVVPMLIILLKYPSKCAHATAILIILPLSLVSGLFYVAFGIKISTLIPVTIGVIIGGIIGALVLKKLSNKWISIIFSGVMIVAGLRMILF